MLRHREENSDSVFKRFDAHQKAKVCGFCEVKTWNQVPPIWREIEATKDEKQLRDLMSAEWSKLKTDLDSDFASVYWEDDLLQVIRTVDFTQGLPPCFLTSAAKAAPLAFMERSVAEIKLLEANRRARGITTTWSFAEAKKDLKAPRLPPVDIKDANSLFTTYAAYLNMMFAGRNAHMLFGM